VALAVVGVAFAAAGCGGGDDEAAGTTAATVAPTQDADFAGTVDIGGGREMYMECRGSGSPTVVLVSGLDTAADLWNIPDQADPKVFPQIAESTRVCAYDRPGAPLAVGGASRSDPVPQPTSPEAAVADLHALLTAADVPGPYVLAGHSYGGIVSRLFAATYPDEVLGMVLVDIVSPELRDAMTAEEWETWKQLNARTEEDIADYPELERIEFDEALDQINAGGAIRQMPLIVLSADELYGEAMEAQAANGELPEGVPADFGYVIDRANAQAQKELAQLVDGAEHITETDSGHNMMIDNAPLVIDAILDVLDAVRAGRPTVAAPGEAGSDLAEAVDIGDGRRMFVECQGDGSPTVVLISGKGNGAADWFDVLDPDDPAHESPGDDLGAGMGDIHPSEDAVFPSVARFTRVCAYDRPDVRWDGADQSTPRAQPHTVDLDVADLHALLAAAGEQGPYVLVPHSYGGLIAPLYARTYPEDVAGLVMVDGATELTEDVVSPATLQRWNDANSMTSDQLREGVELIDAIARIDAAPPMPELPAIVLTADKPWRTDLIPPEAVHPDDFTFDDWLAASDRLASALGAEHITETNSGHNIYQYEPALVTDAIRKVVDDVRAEQEG
jgi:pimeloyl-ACP methyl ester carboxylesterase